MCKSKQRASECEAVYIAAVHAKAISKIAFVTAKEQQMGILHSHIHLGNVIPKQGAMCDD
jgi:hypothetical protein